MWPRMAAFASTLGRIRTQELRAGRAAKLLTVIISGDLTKERYMRAVQLTAYGNPAEFLKYVEIPEPELLGRIRS